MSIPQPYIRRICWINLTQPRMFFLIHIMGLLDRRILLSISKQKQFYCSRILSSQKKLRFMGKGESFAHEIEDRLNSFEKVKEHTPLEKESYTRLIMLPQAEI